MPGIGTGMGTALFKAAMMLYPKEKRLVEDPYAERLLPPLYRFLIVFMRSPKRLDAMVKTRERINPGLLGWMFCRFRYIDDVIKECILKKEIETIVNLGAGCDCRAYYIPGMESISYFEIDHPSIIKKKMVKMEKILGSLPDHVTYVPVDFEKQNLAAELRKSGYNLASRTLFIWEGVSQYISEQANASILDFVAGAAAGSKIVFTYIIKSFIDGKNIHDGIKDMYKRVLKRKNPVWIFGLDPAGMAEYLSKYSLSLIEDTGSEEVRERYMKPVHLNLEIFEIERLVLARVNRKITLPFFF